MRIRSQKMLFTRLSTCIFMVCVVSIGAQEHNHEVDPSSQPTGVTCVSKTTSMANGVVNTVAVDGAGTCTSALWCVMHTTITEDATSAAGAQQMHVDSRCPNSDDLEKCESNARNQCTLLENEPGWSSLCCCSSLNMCNETPFPPTQTVDRLRSRHSSNVGEVGEIKQPVSETTTVAAATAPDATTAASDITAATDATTAASEITTATGATTGAIDATTAANDITIGTDATTAASDITTATGATTGATDIITATGATTEATDITTATGATTGATDITTATGAITETDLTTATDAIPLSANQTAANSVSSIINFLLNILPGKSS